MYNEPINECYEETSIKPKKYQLSLIGIFFYFEQKLLDFCFIIKLDQLILSKKFKNTRA